MKYVKIRANNYNEAMIKLKMEHGDDAIPISHKYVKEGGLFNSKLFAKDIVELTAAVQDKKQPPKPQMAQTQERKKIDFTVGDRENASALPRFQQKKETATARTAAQNIDSVSKTIDSLNSTMSMMRSKPRQKNETMDDEENKILMELLSKSKQDAAETESESSDEKRSAAPPSGFEKEFSEIKQTLNRLLREKERGESSLVIPEDGPMKQFVDILKNNDFEPAEAKEILTDVRNSLSRDEQKDSYKIEKTLKELLKSRIVTSGAIKTGNKKKIVMFVGPTGVGKTTTMAKLGAINSLREGHKVTFITIDNYRIAATEQLKKYAEIMRIPVFSVNSQKEFRDIVSAEKSDLIMVDTSGRSHRNDLKISEIKSFAEGLDYEVEKILCVSANTKKLDLDNVFKAFNAMNFDSVIITKVDETSFVGNVVDIADKYNKPISYYTVGQEVPNDIIVADPEKIVDLMIGSQSN